MTPFSLSLLMSLGNTIHATSTRSRCQHTRPQQTPRILCVTVTHTHTGKRERETASYLTTGGFDRK